MGQGLLYAAVSSTLLGLTHAALYNEVIQSNVGPVQGYAAFNSSPTDMNLTHWKDITVWKGIPFAATTAGENRFRPPQPASKWNSTLDAKDFGAVCPVATSFDNDFLIDEDCLNLNIWSAANSSDAKLPVVMWSYPAESTARDALFDGGGMADKEIVFVNYNYRTGAFGWMAHPELSEERYALNGHNSSGNWGMLDQFAALKWIHENIAAFGGDPDRITVMGQSAGSAASQHILNSELTKGLIVGAIIESGVRYPRDPLCSSLAENYITLEAGLSQGEEFLAYLNVSTIAEARALPMDDLVTSFGGSWAFTATLDYYAMPDTYMATLRKSLAHDVPVLTGNTKDESGATYGESLTLSEYLDDLNSTFGSSWAEKFYQQYTALNSSTAGGAYNAQWTDRSKVGTWLWSRLWRANYKSPIFNYFWDHAPPGQNQGAYHESEINYVLNNLYDTDSPWTSEDYQIAARMNDYWANFIKTGNPNGAGLPKWAEADDSPIVQQVGDGWGSMPVADEAQVALFEAWMATQPVF